MSDADKHAKVQAFRASEWSQRPEELARIERHILDPTRYEMTVALAADLEDGGRVTGGGFGFGGQRNGAAAIWHRYRGPRLSEDPAVGSRGRHRLRFDRELDRLAVGEGHAADY